MLLHPPFCISSRLLPALVIGAGDSRGTLSLDSDGTFWLDLAGGYEHHITDYRPGVSARGDLARMFGDLLCFLSAAGESYRYNGGAMDPDGDDSTYLFPEEVCKWAADYHTNDELTGLQLEIEESETALIEC